MAAMKVMVEEAPVPGSAPESPRSVLALPFGFAILLAVFGALPQARTSSRFAWSFWGVALVLLGWNAALWIAATAKKRTLSARFVIRRPHWLQPIVQLSVYVYWGWHWRLVADSAWMIAAQLVFAYAFDMLLAWSLGDDYELGFGPFPIILSVNLFMWFKPDWFVFQFVMIASGFAAKRLLRWNKEGHRGHIFNPSSLPLFLVSIALLATGRTDITSGNDIANTLALPDHIFEFLFLVSLPGQFLFGVAAMTMPAVLVAWVLSHAYFLGTGVYYFVGPIPTAAFLGMLLLFTDPSTAPRSELGRVIYGALYGLSVFVLYGLLDLFGLPLFYDKLLFVPFLNLGVRAIDRLAASPKLVRFDPARWGPHLVGRKRHLAMMAIWAVTFAGIFAAHGVGKKHPASLLPYWIDACAKNLRNGCTKMEIVEGTLCDKGSAWACNEHGILQMQPGTSAASQADAINSFKRACERGFKPGCANVELAASGPSALQRDRPPPEDYQHLIDNTMLPKRRTGMQELHWACEQGWKTACEDVQTYSATDPASAPGTTAALPDAELRSLTSSCGAGVVLSCQRLGLRYRSGTGVPRDPRRAMACELGLADICTGTMRP
jgi:TPR repeat protein